MKLGLARAQGDALSLAVEAAGWTPVPCHLTAMEATLAPPPCEAPDAVILLSPAAARLALLPAAVPCLAQGPGTARALSERAQTGSPGPVSGSPKAEGLFDLLRAQYPQGGTFLLARGERSREHLEQACSGTPWRLLPWITHRERAVDPLPDLGGLEAVLALSPLQAELLGPVFSGLRLAWGERTQRAFARVGYPCSGWCEPDAAALTRLLLAQSHS